MAQDLPEIRARLASFRRGLRLRFLWAGTARLLTAGVLAVLCLVALDWAVHADDRTARGVLLVVALGILAAVARRALLKPLSLGMSDEDLALAVEAAHPQLQDRLISAVQLSRGADPAFNSPALAARALDEALEACRPLSFEKAVRLPAQGRWTGYALATSVLFALLAWSSPDFRTGLARLLYDRPWPSQYSLEVSEVPASLGQGEDLAVTARLLPGSRRPSRVVLHARAAGGESEVLMPLQADEAYAGVLEHLDAEVTLWVTAGDFRSREYSVRVLEKPLVRSFQLTVTPPDYTGKAPETLPPNSGHLRALRGSTVRITGTSSKPLAACSLKFAKRSVPLTVGEKGGFFGEFRLEETDNYVVVLEDTEKLKASHPISYQVSVIKDQEPFVRILKPGRDLQLVPTAKVPLLAEIQDDWGLGKASLAATLNRSTPQEIKQSLPLMEAPAAKDVRGPLKQAMTWDLAPLKLEPGRQIRYRAEALDLDTVSGPNLGVSQEYGITIVSREDLEQHLQKLIEEIVSDLTRSKGDARKARADLEVLVAAPKDPGREASAANLALTLGRLGQALQQTSESVGAVQELIAMNGLDNAQRDALLKGAREGLDGIVQQRLPAVAEQTRAGARGEAAAWPAALEGQAEVVRQIEAVLKALEGTADLSAFLQRLERMIEQSKHIKDRMTREGGT